jgi:hypothetical protein
MILNSKTLEKLRNLITEETEYRSGPKIVEFCNQLGFNNDMCKVFRKGNAFFGTTTHVENILVQQTTF